MLLRLFTWHIPRVKLLGIKHLSSTSSYFGPPRFVEGVLEEEHREARAWLSRFNVSSIPKNICEVTFSRASGPGGQNVNKVNSKATLRIHTKDFLPLLPKILHPKILSSRYYADKSKSLVLQGDESRSQGANTAICYKKLHALVVEAGRSTIRGETPQAQVERVKALQKHGNEMRLRAKRTHGNKKAARKGGSKKPSY
ncbi:MAG: hypothetical protein Q9163_004645 [Psora crenata]